MPEVIAAPIDKKTEVAPVIPAATPQVITSKFFDNWDTQNPKPTPAPAAAPETAPNPKPEPAAAKKPDAKPPEEITPAADGFDPNLPTPPKRIRSDEIGRVVEAAVAGAMKANRAPEKPEPVAPEKVTPEIPKAIARKLEKLSTLEDERPEFKVVTERAKKFYSTGGEEERYRSEWLKKNPGQKFDRTDEEHDDFYVKHDPLSIVTEEDWEEADDRMLTRRAEQIALKTTADTLSKKELEQRRVQAGESAVQTVDRIFTKAIKSLPGFTGDAAKDRERLGRLNEEDPIAAHVSVQIAKRDEPVIHGIEELFTAGAPFNPNNPTHQAVDRVGVELEDAILRVPADKRRRGSQEFSTMENYLRMSPSEKKRHWTIGREELVNFVETRQVGEVKKLYEELTRGRLVGKSGGAEVAAGAAASLSPAAHVNSPSIGSAAPAPAPGSGGSSSSGQNENGFFRQW